MNAEHRLLLEAGSLATNIASPIARRVAASEASSIDIGELLVGTADRGRLLIAIREATIAAAELETPDARSALGEALRSLVRAARCRAPKPARAALDAPLAAWWADR